jgi:hypothetical protein
LKILTILIPKLKPPFVDDVVNFQMENIINKLKENFNIKVVWVVFGPNKIQEIKEISYDVLDYHNYTDAIEILDKINPDLILIEGIFGMTGITFIKSARFKKIPITTIFPPGISPYAKSSTGVQRRLHLIFSKKILGSTEKNLQNPKLGMLKYFLKRYNFLLKTLNRVNYNLFDIFKFIMFYPASQIFSRQVESIHPICSGDLNFVSTPILQQFLVGLGYDPKTIFVTGDPSFDHTILKIQHFQSVKKTQKKEIIDNDNKFKILFCTSPMHEHGAWTKKQEDSLILNTINEISNSHNSKISLKIHPTSSIKSEYEQLLQKTICDVSLFQKEDLLELIDSNDLMIVYGASSVVLCGILLKKPIVMLNLKNYPSQYNFFLDKNTMSICETMSQLSSIITDSLSTKISNDMYDDYLQNQLGCNDGKSSERIAQIITSIFK